MRTNLARTLDHLVPLSQKDLLDHVLALRHAVLVYVLQQAISPWLTFNSGGNDDG